MKRVLIIAVAAALAAAAGAAYEYAGKWGTPGTGNGQFNGAFGIALASNGNVYVTDLDNHRVQYFTSTGSFLGKWGSYGSGNGQFNRPVDVAVKPSGASVYVADNRNHRVQYFYDAPPRAPVNPEDQTGNGLISSTDNTRVSPTSLGRIKTLFR